MSLPSKKTANDFPFKHSGNPDKYGQAVGGDYALVQTNFDARALYNQTQINSILDALESTTNGDSGADNVNATPLSGGTADTVQGILEELKSSETTLDVQNVKLTGDQTIGGVKTFSSSPVVPTPTTDMQSATKKYVDDTDGNRKSYVDGLDAQNVKLVGTQTIAGEKTFSSSPQVPIPDSINDATPKTYVDGLNTAQTNALNSHKTSSDHDGRYYTEAEIDGFTVKLTGNQTVGGIKTFLSSPIVPTPTTNMQSATKKYVDDTVAGVVLGQIPDNSLTDVKLAPDIKVGSLTTLKTTTKADVTSAINEVYDEINTIVDATTTLTPSVQVLSVTDSTEGIADIEIGGESFYNAIINGDFANGTTGWASTGATTSISNKVISVAGTGATLSPGIYQDTLVKNNTNFVGLKFRVTSADCLTLRATLMGSVVPELEITNPVQNQWYPVYAKKALTAGTPRLLIEHRYADSATANGKVMEVEGDYTKGGGVFAIPLNPPYDTFTADQINFMVNAYFEGFKGSNMLSVESKGRNLFDEFIQDSTSENLTSVDGDKYNSSTRVSSNTFYASFKIKTGNIVIARNALNAEFRYGLSNTKPTNATDAIAVTTAGLNANGQQSVVVNNASSKYLIITFRTATSGVGGYVEKIMLNEGSTVLPYEPYRGRTLSISGFERHKLPNGVQDWMMQKYGKSWAVRNVKEYTLQSGDLSLVTTPINFDYVRFSRSKLVGVIPRIANVSYLGMMASGFVSRYVSADVAGVEWSITDGLSNDNIDLIVPKGTYANLASAQTALAGTKILYQLATPQYIDYADFDANGIDFSGEVSTFEDYTNLAMTSGDITPSPLVTYQCNIKSAVLSLKEITANNTEAIQRHEKYLVKNEQIVTGITSGFSTNWSGTIIATKNHNNLVMTSINLDKAIDITTAYDTLYILPLELRPIATVCMPVHLLNSSGGLIVGSDAILYIQTDGLIVLLSGGTLTGARRIFGMTFMYYTA